MQSGALDYLEEPLSAADMVALLETFIPRRTSSHRTSRNAIKAAKPSKRRTGKTESNQVQSEMTGEYGETRKSLGSAFRRGHPGSGISDSCRIQN
jgi:DNA-binding NtrC family response regulator